MDSKKAVFLIMVLGLALYANSLSGQFIWDDEVLVRDNLYVRNWHNMGEIFTSSIWQGSGTVQSCDYYRPLQIVSYTINYSLGKLNTVGYHLINILLHIFTALCIYWLICLLFGNKILSLITAVFFVSHPVQVDVVAYISERGNLLAMLFALLSFIFYIKLLHKNKITFYVITALSYLLAILSKENSLILPFLLLLYHYAFRKKIRYSKFLPFLLIAFAYILSRITILRFAPFYIYPITAVFSRIAGFFVAITNYIRLLIFPFGLHMEYGDKLFRLTDPKAFLGAAIAFLSIYYAFKKRKTNPLIFFSICWFFLALLPVSNIYPIGAYMAEHNLYVPSMGFFLILAYGLSNLLKFEDLRIISIAAIAVLTIFYSFLTIVQTNYWKNPITFYERTLRYNPDSARVNNNLGNMYNNMGNHEKAFQLYKKAIQIDPNFVDVYFNIGKAYESIGMREEAIKSFARAIELNPEHWSAYNELGLMCNESNKNEEAIRLFERAIEANPRYAQPYINLGMLYAKIGKKEDAVRLYEMAIQLNPYIGDSYYNLANLYLKYGEKGKAEQLYRKTIAINEKDTDAYNNLGVIYRDAGDMEKAIELFRKAIEAKPDNALTYYNLAVVYSRMKQHDLAAKYYDKAKALGLNVREGGL
ncbi:MAG: tetratricopeptide repeat protein [Candidatus Omnitrophica bacterium]|nr:tetratricopeptide repeat protein [Candidatus Omnitrophota bacterium]